MVTDSTCSEKGSEKRLGKGVLEQKGLEKGVRKNQKGQKVFLVNTFGRIKKFDVVPPKPCRTNFGQEIFCPKNLCSVIINKTNVLSRGGGDTIIIPRRGLDKLLPSLLFLTQWPASAALSKGGQRTRRGHNNDPLYTSSMKKIIGIKRTRGWLIIVPLQFWPSAGPNMPSKMARLASKTCPTRTQK